MSSAYFMLKFLQKRRSRKKEDLKNQNNSPVDFLEDDVSKESDDNCRLCMKEAGIIIFDNNVSFDIVEAISTFGGIEVNKDDDYSKKICVACFNFLESAVSFRKTVQDTDEYLRQTSNVKYEDWDDGINEDDTESYAPKPVTKSYNCKLCKIKFKTLDELVTHKSSRSHKNVRIQCPICFGLLTAQLYKKHLVRHQSASHLICDICGKLYRKDNLVRHLQLHNFELPFQCQLCPYRGRFMESLKIHMRTHTGDKPFSCDKCELRFLTRSNLNRHLLTHKKERPFKCVECGRGFYTKRDMDAHFKSDHAGMKDFSCCMCGNKYGTRKALMRHELRVHKRNKMAKGRLPLYLQAEYQK